jgi:hypothetical protein
MNEIEIKKVTISGTGVVAAQTFDALDKIALADIAAILTIAYTAWLLGTSIYDRVKGKKGKK